MWNIILQMKQRKTSKKLYRYSDEICHNKVPTVTSVNEREGGIHDNVRIPRKGEQDDGSDNVDRVRRNRNRNRNRKIILTDMYLTNDMPHVIQM